MKKRQLSPATKRAALTDQLLPKPKSARPERLWEIVWVPADQPLRHTYHAPADWDCDNVDLFQKVAGTVSVVYHAGRIAPGSCPETYNPPCGMDVAMETVVEADNHPVYDESIHRGSR